MKYLNPNNSIENKKMKNVMLNVVKHLFRMNNILPRFVRQNDRSHLYFGALKYFYCLILVK
jgi:hypothetical protein